MKIPSYVTLYQGRKKLKIGSECPKDLESILQKAIDAKTAHAEVLAKRFAAYPDEEKVISRCSAYPEYNEMVLRKYKELRAAKPKKEKEKSSK
jgi:hypothetical protein